jgi:hypothetical protein
VSDLSSIVIQADARWGSAISSMTKHAASVTEPNDRRWTSPTIQIASAGWPGFILGAPHGHLTAGLSSLLRSRPSLFRRMSCDASSHAGSLSDSATWSLRRKRPLPANHSVVEAVVEEGGRPALLTLIRELDAGAADLDALLELANATRFRLSSAVANVYPDGP